MTTPSSQRGRPREAGRLTDRTVQRHTVDSRAYVIMWLLLSLMLRNAALLDSLMFDCNHVVVKKVAVTAGTELVAGSEVEWSFESLKFVLVLHDVFGCFFRCVSHFMWKIVNVYVET